MTTSAGQLGLRTAAGPEIARHRLGIKLRELREQRSVRLEDVAARLQVAPSTLSRIETGKAPARRHYLASLLDAYGVNDPELRERLAALAREGEHKAWWAAYRDLLPDGAGRYLGMEAAACLVCSYSVQIVPALLQTADYAAAASRAARPGLTASQVRTLAAITMRRQKCLRGNGTRLHVVVDESALRRSIAPAGVMAAQLDHLRALAVDPSLTLRISALNRHLPVLSPPFAVLSYADPADAGVAASCGPGGRVIISTDDRDVRAAQATFTTLADAALPPGDSVRIIGGHISEFR